MAVRTNQARPEESVHQPLSKALEGVVVSANGSIAQPIIAKELLTMSPGEAGRLPKCALRG